jgi:hypothetical protein
MKGMQLFGTLPYSGNHSLSSYTKLSSHMTNVRVWIANPDTLSVLQISVDSFPSSHSGSARLLQQFG